MIYSLSVSKSFGSTATAASLASLEDTIAYATGAGVATITDQRRFSFQVCAPKQLKEGTAPQLGSMNTESKASLRINSISCVALSQECVSVGETGHCPRVVIFSRTSNRILATMQEHQFGVNLMRFSPSGRLLATLGTPQDGYLYVWHTAPKVTPAVSNRCISEVNALCWLSESTLVTAGVRHLRVWTVSEGTSVLSGRNIVLGEAADSKFTALLSIGEGTFLVANENGQVYKVSGGQLELQLEIGEPVHSLVSQDEYIAAGPNSMTHFSIGSQKTVATGSPARTITSQALVAAGPALVYLDGSTVSKVDGEVLSGRSYTGVSKRKGGFIAWDPAGISLFDSEANFVRDEEHAANAQQARLAYSLITDSNDLACAYENGSVIIGSCEFAAHEPEGAPIFLSQGFGWVLSAGRDSLQIYKHKGNSWEQWQTLSLHGRATRARVVDASTLVATATNKVMNIVRADSNSTFVVAKSIATASPIQDFTVYNGKLWTSTLDKKLSCYDLATGQLEESFATCDMLGEALAINNLNFINFDDRAYIVASANDKSIVMYDERGELVACQWAHTELPSSILVCENNIVSIARDGMFVYHLEQLPKPSTSRPASPVRILRGTSPTRSASPTRAASPTRGAIPTKQLRSVGSVGNMRGRASSPDLGAAARTAKSPPRSPQRSPRKTLDTLKLAPPPPQFTVETDQSQSPSQQPQQQPSLPRPTLSLQLRQYIESGASDATLFPLLVKALEKSDEKRALKYYAKRLSEYLEDV